MRSVYYTQELIRCRSLTPKDAGCFEFIQSILEPLGFRCWRLPFHDVDNLYARLGTEGFNFCFAGHTDVVPVGNETAWRFSPFEAKIENNMLYGRGAVDMKGAIGSFLAATEVFLQKNLLNGSLSFLLTSDEEGPAQHGTQRVVQWLQEKNERLDFCLVGEPTSETYVGDVIKKGRRGSLNGRVTVTGTMGHVAYPHKAINPIPILLRYLDRLFSTPLDSGVEGFQPSHLEITSVDVGNKTTNIIPACASACFNVRFNPTYTRQTLVAWLNDQWKLLDDETVAFHLETSLTGESFATHHSVFQEKMMNAVSAVTRKPVMFSTSGGISDARFIRTLCPVMELGLLNDTAHKIDECVSLSDLEQLTHLYEKTLQHFV